MRGDGPGEITVVQIARTRRLARGAQEGPFGWVPRPSVSVARSSVFAPRTPFDYAATGSVKRNVEPFPGSLSTVTLLPWASMHCFTTANPIPTPPYCRVSELSTW
jgi:hypothetical protein